PRFPDGSEISHTRGSAAFRWASVPHGRARRAPRETARAPVPPSSTAGGCPGHPAPGPCARRPDGAGTGRARSWVGSAQRASQVGVERAEELLGGQVPLIAADEQREVLGHLTALDGLDDDVLEGLREADDLGGVVQLAA